MINNDISNHNILPEPFSETEDSGFSDIKVPFDPSMIDIRPQPLTILSIIRRLESEPRRIKLDTEFQRSVDLWDTVRQSRLIESLMVRIPIPAFYFDASEEEWLVVDGLQRISALKNFLIDKTLRLQGLEFLTNLNGKNVEDIISMGGDFYITRIEETSITAYLINPGTPPFVKFIIFKRINTGGLRLTAQEIRHALNNGIPSRFVADLAAIPEFQKAMGGKVPTKRMEDRDYVTRFLAFYLDRQNYSPDIDDFLNKAMASLNEFSDDKKDEIKKSFTQAMIAANAIFKDFAFRKRFKLTGRKKPINKALFEAISVNLAHLSPLEHSILKKQKIFINKEFIWLCVNDVEFINSLTTGTGDPKAVEIRHTRINLLFNKALTL